MIFVDYERNDPKHEVVISLDLRVGVKSLIENETPLKRVTNTPS